MSTTVEEIKKTEIKKEKKDELLLDSLEIKGFRCFEHLSIQELGRVNLIVGKNNVGKTAFLEALWLYTSRGNINTLIRLLLSRDELSPYTGQHTSPSISGNDFTIKIENLSSELRNLFFGRRDFGSEGRDLAFIGSKDSYLKISTIQLRNENGSPKMERGPYFDDIWIVLSKGLSLSVSLVENGEETYLEFFSLTNFQNLLRKPLPQMMIQSTFVKSNGLNHTLLARLWDDALRKGLEERAIHFLKTIAEQISYINFVGAEDDSSTRYPIASIQNSMQRVPLKSFGEGLARLLGLSLSFVQCEHGILLIDEIESGLHYSVLPDVWKLIFKTAKDLNVQVFATTHSFDCIEAFAQASIEDKESEGNLIRLENKNGAIKAVTFSENELETVTRRNIEVR
ncbi:MAG: AAA family ATPase [Acidobacteria bacterium]|nr:AAA family ATPase [Acidobacteriota bacterium]MCA1637023.1 AAA family ATPase [Acidobacteriota bacterium]